MHDALVERTGVTYDPYTPEQQASVVQMIERYIDASETEEENCLVIHSFRHMIEICRQFKLMIKRARQEISVVKEEALAGMMSQQYVATMEGRAGTTTDLHSNIQYSSDSKLIEDFHSQTAMVGELDYSKSKGFPLGVANPESRPQHGINMQYMSSKTASMPTNTSSYSTKDGKERYYSPSLPQKSSDNKGKTSLVMDLNQTKLPSSNLTNLQTDTQTQGIFKTPFSSQNPSSMFTSFINTDGDQYFHDFQQMKLKLKSFRQQIKNTINELNDIKLQIDSYHNEIEKRKQARIILLRQSGLKIGETEDIVDEEEFQLMKQLRETKNHYKEQYDNLQELKMNSNQTQEYVEKCREILSIKFNEWCRNGLLSTSDSMVLNDGYHDNNIILSPQKSQALRTTNVIPSSYDENPLNHTVDQLDDQEAFDRLEESRVIANDPDSLAFFNANKTRRALQTQNLTAIRNMQRTKRLPL
jgi:kinesin family protein 6/9